MPDTLLGGIIINEILVDPNSASGANFDTDGNGTANAVDEYVELYNTSAAAIDISGLQLWDAGVGHWFTFPPGTILAAGGHALVMSGLQSGGALPTGDPGDLFFDAGRNSPLFNNGGDNVTLLDPSGAGTFIQATYNGDALDDPTLGAGGYSGFPAGAVRNGSGENFGNDVDGQSLQRTGDGATTFSTEAPTPGTTNICFADGTHLSTPSGSCKVECLQVGDLVLTADGRAVPVRWTFSKQWSAQDMAAQRKLAPVCISKGALGLGLPARDLRLSQQHRILVKGPIVQRMFGTQEVLVAAKSLLSLPGIYIDTPRAPVRYFHILLDAHDIVIAEGLRSESLYLGPQALRSIPDAALCEALMLLGLDRETLEGGKVMPARPHAQMKRARRLIARHTRNDKPIIAQL
ncbi:Hemolysin-type calcium-binding region [Sulfitobacter noctilucicola]|uniref:LTD domain-containing protein n=1 Tax=Sulfitobacter noctilucicola TaxID=1342301 RepID=A0A7W6M9F5_9RHOB|nr:Hint domain-containing protein [Sulfitobacter noctilucicola]KIN63608.1 Hemolysin-type calcium-binding region [Sulfitobacter noctilucicola]MBB4174881.1 hypothetical protein [Sulfitobacter noctilucicola]